ncbi:hypothetical protein R3P38DRAFT_3593866 [Favolaschia claudopus]|uniref:Uncharacterized protein n=1 Tax=Favolaschia claudopus TaxID=2862362 RepID=A0AAW0DFY2_9AGAR
MEKYAPGYPNGRSREGGISNFEYGGLGVDEGPPRSGKKNFRISEKMSTNTRGMRRQAYDEGRGRRSADVEISSLELKAASRLRTQASVEATYVIERTFYSRDVDTYSDRRADGLGNALKELETKETKACLPHRLTDILPLTKWKGEKQAHQKSRSPDGDTSSQRDSAASRRGDNGNEDLANQSGNPLLPARGKKIYTLNAMGAASRRGGDRRATMKALGRHRAAARRGGDGGHGASNPIVEQHLRDTLFDRVGGGISLPAAKSWRKKASKWVKKLLGLLRRSIENGRWKGRRKTHKKNFRESKWGRGWWKRKNVRAELMLNPERTEQLKTWRNGRSTSCWSDPLFWFWREYPESWALSAAIRARLVGVVLARNKRKRKLLRLMERGNLCWFSLGTRRLASRYLRKGISLVQHPKREMSPSLLSTSMFVFSGATSTGSLDSKLRQVTYDTSSKRYPAPFGLWQRGNDGNYEYAHLQKVHNMGARLTEIKSPSYCATAAKFWGRLERERWDLCVCVQSPSHYQPTSPSSAWQVLRSLCHVCCKVVRCGRAAHGAVKWGDLRANSSSWVPFGNCGDGYIYQPKCYFPFGFILTGIIVIFGASDYTGKCKGASRLRLRRSLRSEVRNAVPRLITLANSVLIPSPFPSTIIIPMPKLCPFEFKSQVRPISFIIMPRLCSYFLVLSTCYSQAGQLQLQTRILSPSHFVRHLVQVSISSSIEVPFFFETRPPTCAFRLFSAIQSQPERYIFVFKRCMSLLAHPYFNSSL